MQFNIELGIVNVRGSTAAVFNSAPYVSAIQIFDYIPLALFSLELARKMLFYKGCVNDV